jgi:MFS family permease
MNPWAGLKGMPRDVWVISIATLVNRAGTMVLPFLVLYLTDELGFTAARAGFLMAVYGAGALVAAPVAGWLCDRYGGLRIMRESLWITGGVLFLLPWFRDFYTVAALVFLLALINEMFRPANLAYVSLLVTPENRKPAFSLVRLAINLGMSIGPAAGGFLADVSFVWLFVIDGFTSVVAGAMLGFAKLRDVRAEHVAHAETTPQSTPSALKDVRFLLFLAGLMPIAILFFQHISAMPLFLVKHLGMAPTVYGLMFTINTLIIVALEVPFNMATSHWSYRFTLFLGCLLFGVGFGGMMFASGFWTVVITVVIWTFGEMILFPGASAYVAHVAVPARSGQYMGIYTMLWGSAFMFAPWLGTYALEHYGPQVLWGSMFVLGGASAAAMLLVVRKD